MPFTTPLLSGARVRESRQSGVEMVVPNPSGGRGVYIVLWAGVRALCVPTVHDTMLFQQISGLTRIDPASVRDAAIDVALEGYAGREAAGAAEAALTSDRERRLITHVSLLAALVGQVEPNGLKLTERTPDFDRRVTAVLHRVAPSFGCPAAHLASGLAALGDAFAPVGAESDDQGARLPRLIARLRDTRAGLSRWLDADPEHDISGLGRAMSATMQLACDNGAAALAYARSTLADPAALLKRWTFDAGGTLGLASRCDWLLDGWERVCMLWLVAQSAAVRRAALLEMAQMLPVLPAEISEWTELPLPPAAMDETCRVISYNDTWRRGSAAFALIQRNEKLRAMIT